MGEKYDVVIAGISGRFPECDDVHTFKKKLYNGDNFITFNDKKWPLGYKYQLGKYSVPNGTGKYTDAEAYDYRFFKMHTTNAANLSIINRKVLEPSFEAIVDAGLNPHSLSGECIGVFTSCSINEQESNMSQQFGGENKLLGLSCTMQANRISYTFNFTGPSHNYCTDVLGSLQALGEGYRQVANGYVSAALVGCSSSILDPKNSINFGSLNLLSEDGLCRAFDKNANGYGRSEGAVMFFLQRAEDAKRIYGKILICDALYPGAHMSTLLEYNEEAIKKCLKVLYDSYNFTNNKSYELGFMETNALGIKHADLIELNGLAEFICKNRTTPLLVGSVKSNVGHTEGSSAALSLLKAVFAIDTGIIGPNINFTAVDNEIAALKNRSLQVVDEPTMLPGNVVGVNTIGLGGMISHAVLKQHDDSKCKKEFVNTSRLLLICGRTEVDLIKAIEKIENMSFSAEFISLANDAFSSSMPMHVYRGYAILPKPFKAKHLVQEKGASDRPIWFIFSGTGSQWNGMGHKLLDLPIFAEVIKKCDAILQPKGIDIYHLLTDEDPKLFDNILNSFLAINCVQFGLVEVLKCIGIHPDGMLAHSTGEVGCAYADDCLTLEEALLTSYERGFALTTGNTVKGMMAAVGKGYNQIKDEIPDGIEVACHNSAESCTLSGPAEKVTEFVEKLKADGIFAKSVNVGNVAAHSKYIASLQPMLLKNLKKVIKNPKKRSSKWVCTSLPPDQWDIPLSKTCSAEYMTNNTMNYVFFEEGMKEIPENAIVVEIAPHGLLQSILRQALPSTCTNISLTQRSLTKENLFTLYSAIGQLYIAGCEPQINNLFPKIQYPVSRGTPSISPFCTWSHDEIEGSKEACKLPPEVPLSQELISIKINEDSEYCYLKFHKINDRVVIPSSFFMYLAWWILSIKKKVKLEATNVIFENIKIHKNIKISTKKARYVSAMIQDSGYFHVHLGNEESSEDSIILSGKIELSQDQMKTCVTAPSQIDFAVSSQEYHKNLEKTGYQLQNSFASVEALSVKNTDCYAKVAWKKNWVIFMDCLMKIQRYSTDPKQSRLFYPYFVRKLSICGSQFAAIENNTVIFCHMDTTNNRIVCNGLEMCGLEHNIVPRSLSSYGLKLKPLHFISFKNPSCKNMKEFTEFALLLTVRCTSENYDTKIRTIIMTPTLSSCIYKITKNNKYLKSKIKFCDRIPKANTIQKKPILAITTNLSDTFNYDFEFVLAIIPSIQIDRINKESYWFITKQTLVMNTLCLLKKKLHGPSSAFDIQPKRLASNAVECHYKVNYNGKCSSIVIRREIESNDLELLLSRQNDSHTCYFYVTDDGEKIQENGKSFLKFPIERGLPSAVFKNGEWGSYFSMSRNPEKTPPQLILPTNMILDSIHVHFYHLDGRENFAINNTFQEEEDTFGVGFSGIDSSGKKVIGLASVNIATSTSSVDPQFVWQIPDNWSLKEAVTIPFAYSLAHYMLTWLTHKTDKMCALINMEDDDDLLGQTCISLLLKKNAEVYVAVSSKKEAALLKQRFPSIKENHILLKKCGLEYQQQLLYLTGKKGVDLVINNSAGSNHVSASFQCVNAFGLYVETVESNCNVNYKIGMLPFNKFATFKAIPKKISSLLNLSIDDKIKIRDEVEEGIRRGLVIPLPKTHSENGPTNAQSDAPCIRKELSCLPPTNANKVTLAKLQYDNTHSYIIIVGKGSRWTELLEWLIEKDARNIIVILDDPPNKNITNERNCSVLFLSSEEINTAEKTKLVVSMANGIAQLEAIYFLSVADCNETVRYLKIALQYYNLKAYFINLFSGGLKALEQINSQGFPALAVHSREMYSGSLPNVLNILDESANMNLKSPPLFYEVIQKTLSTPEPKPSTFDQYLPNDLETWAIIGESLTKGSKFIERTTQSLRYAETQGVYPIFVLPAIDGVLLDPLFKKLMYPVFCATLPESVSNFSDLASELFQELNKIQPRGPVTLLSETWNSVIAVALSSLIRQSNRKFKVFLLDGNPLVWKERSTYLESIVSSTIKNNESKPSVLFQNESNSENVVLDARCQESATKAWKAVRNRLLMISQNEYKNEILENFILFSSHYYSNEDSLNLSINSDIFDCDEDDYRNLIKNEEVSSKINEHAAFSWWTSRSSGE